MNDFTFINNETPDVEDIRDFDWTEVYNFAKLAATVTGEIGTLALGDVNGSPAFSVDLGTDAMETIRENIVFDMVMYDLDYNSFEVTLPEDKQLVGIQAQVVGGIYLTDVALVFASRD